MQRHLPIFGIESEILSNLRTQSRLIIVAPTGSGKSTQVPQMILEAGLNAGGQILVLQPRRLAARLLAARVARERNQSLGGEVGYQVRFENCTSGESRLVYITEGILLMRLQSDPQLRGVSVVVFDEFHERHLFSDVCLARVLALQNSLRPDLKIVVMSATLDMPSLQEYLAPAVVLRTEGRCFPVAIRYLTGAEARPAEKSPIWDLAVEQFEKAIQQGAEGHALIFMPGMYEIERTLERLEASPVARKWARFPLHGDLAPALQDAAVSPSDRPKVVVATNVAESSVTIEGIRLVIDSGFARIPRFDPHRGINTLYIEKISQAAADQRAGRAGRTAPGWCVRLWTERDHLARPRFEQPEVHRLDLSEIVLLLKASGIEDVHGFNWYERPSEKLLAYAERLLCDLGAVDSRTGALTSLGRQMSQFPVHPRYSRMLLAGAAWGRLRSTALICALTQGRSLLTSATVSEVQERQQRILGEEDDSDLFVWARAWRYAEENEFDFEKCRRAGIHAHAARQVRPLYEYFLRLAQREDWPVEPEVVTDDAVRKCILTGFIDQLACRQDEGTLRCRLIPGRQGELSRQSVVRRAPLFVASEIREIENSKGEVTVRLSLATAVREEWLREMYPEEWSETTRVEFDRGSGRVMAFRDVVFRDLVIRSSRLSEVSADLAARCWAEQIQKGQIRLPQWDATVEQWITRVRWLSRVCPELGIPAFTESDRRSLIEKLCMGCFSKKEVQDKPVKPLLQRWLKPEQQEILDREAPERVTLSNGRTLKVTYKEDAPPQIFARIQELYGVEDLPRLGLGRVPLVVQILAPNQRPVQVTDDLAGFWREHYPRIKREFQRRYPKHEWR